jgi:hypothetical protein
VTQVYSILIKNAEKKDQAFRIKVKNIEAAYQQSNPFIIKYSKNT